MATQEPRPTSLAERIVYLKTWSKTARRFVEALPDWITPNRVTLLRAALAAPVYLALSDRRFWTALALVALAMALDVVDGAIAHVKNMSTPSGAFLDPLADKLILTAALVAVWPLLPAWILVVAIASIITASAITLARIGRLLGARRTDGPALAQAVAAKPAGKMKTIFDVLGSLAIIVGLAVESPAVVHAGGGLVVAGSLLAGYIHFFRDGRMRGLHPAGTLETAGGAALAA